MFFFIEIPVIKANGVHPDRTPRLVASNLGLHYMPVQNPFVGFPTKMDWFVETTVMNNFSVKISNHIQSNVNGSNIFGTMEISSRLE